MKIFPMFGKKPDHDPLFEEKHVKDKDIKVALEEAAAIARLDKKLRKGLHIVFVITMLTFFIVLALNQAGLLPQTPITYERLLSNHKGKALWCNLPINRESPPQFRVLPLRTKEEAIFDLIESDFEPDDLTERIEFGDGYESVMVTTENRATTILHDFDVNKTAYIDADHCFLTDLNENFVMSPNELLLKAQLETPFDLKIIQFMVKVMLPKVEKFSESKPIVDACLGKPMYLIAEDTGVNVRKRSTDVAKRVTFAYFSGKNIQKVDIVNLEELLSHEEMVRKGTT